jgi:hypothetical protein
MSKRYKGKTCAYCGQGGASQTADHVLARAFVAQTLRGKIPVVPACFACNSAKADLEHYAASILPFGGRHAGASATLANDLPKRLAKNQRLHNELKLGQSRVWSEESGLMIPCLAIPIDGHRLEGLVGFIVRGLMFHHWGVPLGADSSVEAYSLTPRGEQTFHRYLGMNAAQHVSDDIGQGALIYRGLQAVDNPTISMWELSLYGGFKTLGDDLRIASTKYGVMTGPVAVIERAAQLAASELVFPS